MKTRVQPPNSQPHSPVLVARRSPYAAVITAVSLALASAARAQSGSEDSSLFGYLGQLNAAVTVQNVQPINPNACVPTATADGLSYLYNYAASESQPAPLTYAPSYTTVNNLATLMNTEDNNYYQYYNAANQLVYTSENKRNDAAAQALGATTFKEATDIGGTGTYDMFNGLQSYLTTVNPAPNVTISGMIGGFTPAGWLTGSLNAGMNVAKSIPTAQYLAGQLNAHNAVELTLEWGQFDVNNNWVSEGGHEVLLSSIDLTGGQGTLDYLDPQGAATAAAGMTGDIILGADGYLYLSGFTGKDLDENPSDVADSLPGADIAPDATQYARIDIAMVEAVPEPAVFGILGALGALLMSGARYLPKFRRVA